MYTIADLILCCIISGAVGFFWAIYRSGDTTVTIEKLSTSVKVDMREFWEQAERWRSRQGKQ